MTRAGKSRYRGGLDKVARIRELQRGRTGSAAEAEIQELLLDTHGSDLTALKNALDEGDDHRDLVQLVYSDIDDSTIRSSILVHFQHEAASAPAHGLKVLSDIDDTFYANWADERFPKKTVYPGVMQLYAELGGDVTFITARPMDRVGLIERATHVSLREKGLESVTVLSGSFRNLLGNERIADKKLENFERYVSVFPEYDFVFVGDSGQGDAMFGRRMLDAEPERVKAVLIHDIGKPDVERVDGPVYFHTYVGAAVHAFERDLISAEAVGRVVEAAREDFGAVAFDTSEQRDARRAELAADIRRAPA